MTECGGNIGSNEKEVDLFDTSIPIWDRIKTVEDAITYTGMTLPDNIEEMPLDVQAFLKLRIVTAAYNELKADQLDQFPKFTIGEYRYYPLFYLYTQEEIDAMSEDDRANVLFVGGYADDGAPCGVSCASSNNGFSVSSTYLGARLAFYDSRRAKYAGRQFIELYAALNFRAVKTGNEKSETE